MTLLFIVILFAAAVAIAHATVLFIERPKASWWKAAAVVVSFTLFNNLAHRFALEMPTALEWIVYVAFVAFVVWVLFRLKPLNNLTVAACYVVGRWALVYAVSLLPLDVLLNA
jgi:hypothetical protein